MVSEALPSRRRKRARPSRTRDAELRGSIVGVKLPLPAAASASGLRQRTLGHRKRRNASLRSLGAGDGASTAGDHRYWGAGRADPTFAPPTGMPASTKLDGTETPLAHPSRW